MTRTVKTRKIADLRQQSQSDVRLDPQKTTQSPHSLLITHALRQLRDTPIKTFHTILETLVGDQILGKRLLQQTAQLGCSATPCAHSSNTAGSR